MMREGSVCVCVCVCGGGGGQEDMKWGRVCIKVVSKIQRNLV